jgi:plastocyanin
MLALAPSIEALAATQAQMVNCGSPPGWCFSPAVISVVAGATVTWTNNTSVPHTSTADNGSWTAGTIASPIASGSSGTVTFSSPGTFTYHCALHPNMHGTIVVTGVVPTPSPSAAAPSPSIAPPAPSIAPPAPSIAPPAPSIAPPRPSIGANRSRGLARTGGGRPPVGAPTILLGATLVGLGLAFVRKRSRNPIS